MSSKLKIRGRFDRKRVIHPHVEVEPHLLTKQEPKDECDMNIIVRRAMKGIAPAWLNSKQPRFGDFSEVPTLREAHERVLDAQEAFMSLPAALRRELGNDPVNIDDLTREQASRYGLLKPSLEPSAAPAAGQAASGGTEPPQAAKAASKAKPSESSTQE